MNLQPPLTGDLEAIALQVRRRCIDLSARGSCFLGSALSVTDILVALYGSVLRFDPQQPNAPDRDRVILSKGHAVPALYAILELLDVLPTHDIDRHATTESLIYWHPNETLPGIDAATGSLGQGLSVACGMALAAQLDGSAPRPAAGEPPPRAFAIIGDGETQEGVVWETALFAAANNLDNLIVIIDRNWFQANMETENLIPMEPLAEKWQAFGWDVQRVDGHSAPTLTAAFEHATAPTGKPVVIIADTVRGKGVPSIEARADKWIVKATEAEADDLLAELEENA